MIVCRNQEIAATSSIDNLNEARNLRQQILDNGYTDKLFLEIVKLENWKWFADYYNHPTKELLSQGTILAWDKIDTKRNDGELLINQLVDWVVVLWDKLKIKELVMSGKLLIGYSEHLLLEEWWNTQNDTKYITHAIEIGYLPPFTKHSNFEKTIMEEIGFENDSNKSICQIMSKPELLIHTKYFKIHSPASLIKRYWGLRDRKTDEAQSIKKMISYSLGDINLITKQKQFERLTNTWHDVNGTPYKMGEIIVLDIGTNRIPLLNEMTDEQREKRLSDMHSTKLQCIGYQFVGGHSGQIIYNQGTFQKKMENLLCGVKLIITFNGIRFDGIVLKSHGVNIETKYKHYDIYSAIRLHTNFSRSLGQFCKYNNLSNKLYRKYNLNMKAIAAENDAKLTSALFVLLTCFELKIFDEVNSNGLVTSINEGIDLVLDNNKQYVDERKITIHKFWMKYGGAR